jgi:lipase chaperone LimK
MRVYEPDRDRSTFQAILKELYVLRQAIDHQALSVDERVKMIDKIRHEIQQVAQA